jgi:signal-transduction protein with cAMP-binding, CBS, and nucleotidyltransferase domain
MREVAMDVSQIATMPAVTCAPGTTIQEAAWLMRDEGVGSLVVVHRSSLRGIVTDRDLIVRAVARGLSLDTPVEHVMTTDVAFVCMEDDISVAATHMAARGCRRLPVVDGLGRVEGVVTLDDLVSALSDQIGKLAHTVRAELVL